MSEVSLVVKDVHPNEPARFPGGEEIRLCCLQLKAFAYLVIGPLGRFVTGSPLKRRRDTDSSD